MLPSHRHTISFLLQSKPRAVGTTSFLPLACRHVATPLVVGILLPVFHNRQSSSNPATPFFVSFFWGAAGLFLLQSLSVLLILLYVLSNWFSPFFSMSRFRRLPVF